MPTTLPSWLTDDPLPDPTHEGAPLSWVLRGHADAMKARNPRTPTHRKDTP